MVEESGEGGSDSPLSKGLRYYTPSQTPPDSPPKSATATPAFYTPPTSRKPPASETTYVVSVEDVQYVFEESKSSERGQSSSRTAQDDTDLTELD